MKIIFLDIDGVLNSMRYDRERSAEQGNIDETRLPLLREITEQTQAKIVLSTSWRKHWSREASLCDEIGRELDAIFVKYGLAIFDKTPVLSGNDRAQEIRAWLSEHGEVSAFVILDDIRLGWGELQEHLVNTNPRIGRGLEARHVLNAVAILNGETTQI